MKSGNFWLWNVIEAALQQAKVPRKSFLREQPIYRVSKTWDLAFEGEGTIDFVNITRERQAFVIPPVFMWPIDDFDDYVSRCTHVWTHSDLMEGRERYFGAFDKIVYVIRDPRDISLSVKRFDANAFRRRFYGTSPDQPIEAALGWDRNVEGHLASKKRFRIHVLFYERLLHAWDAELDALLDYLELELSASQKRAVAKRTRFGEMKKRSALHVAKGEAYGWARDLDDRSRGSFTSLHRPLLELLGYPLDETAATAQVLPAVPSQQRLTQFFKRGQR
ncbi:MAG TPA: sulfotransferase domain-containing protein [Kofleriaceae bacterium]